MFARQMAVMKGQAWNVVETLKMADHGPLELTRRAKVCVWDDLVDVPVAVPLRVSPSAAAAAAAARGAHAASLASSRVRSPDSVGGRRPMSLDEVDIGASAAASSSLSKHIGPAPDDLLGPPSPPADMPSPGRFGRHHADPIPIPEGPAAASSSSPLDPLAKSAPTTLPSSASPPPPARRPGLNHPAHSTPLHRTLLDGSRSIAQNMYDGNDGDNGEAASRRGLLYDYDYFNGYGDGGDDDGDGDLGYAAAQDMEGHRRKVIVERLEAVKSRNPVFTCW
jgi:phosphatidylinositol 4-kinase type 2